MMRCYKVMSKKYSKTCLKRTLWGPILLSALDKCPLQTGYNYETLTREMIFWGQVFCPL